LGAGAGDGDLFASGVEDLSADGGVRNGTYRAHGTNRTYERGRICRPLRGVRGRTRYRGFRCASPPATIGLTLRVNTLFRRSPLELPAVARAVGQVLKYEIAEAHC